MLAFSLTHHQFSFDKLQHEYFGPTQLPRTSEYPISIDCVRAYNIALILFYFCARLPELTTKN